MKDLSVHVLLFLVVSFAIVIMSCFFSESDDRRALATFPRRMVVFVLGCSALCGLLLLIEHTVARVS